MSQFGDFQNEIYFNGLQGIKPALPVDFKRLEERAGAALSPSLLSYVQGGCGDEFTQRRNAEAFHDWGIVPRMLVDTRVRDMSVNVFGKKLASPLMLAPIGVIGACAQDGHGDIATAKAAAAAGVPMIASTLMNDPLETVAEALGEGDAFFQLYTPRDRDLAESFVQRAETAGYKGIVVTLDTWLTGWRPRDLNDSNFPQLRGVALANYFSDLHFRSKLTTTPDDDVAAAVRHWTSVFGKVVTWEDLSWLRSLTRLPLIVKGIQHPDDAKRAIDAGVDAIYCSNHGGRQANGGIASIDLLPALIAACGNVPVWFDSGIRSGSDVIKALAMGASMVGIGRPYAYGLALGGTAGIVHVVRAILAEADLLMAVNGLPDLAALREAGVRRTRV
ncbi:alpha-hydroxy-acid oxidizing protein [Cupriavidus lacunae]|uniref:Lactate 2-monooxygenase n=1 Tax=Cupriavidus lacunae TaxID=2666307 RepID=A0A370P224_9BURK|nr:alpha-hydroxy-acid oxidizing protein [Cupriavidus lacunae]RDK11910.1 lactate 2-monooxygenase [Cupriavidus lacunae]